VWKNFACYQLAAAARYPILVFMDADVRISRPDALARLAYFLQTSGAALVSGIPRQETHGWMEKLIVPLIHFILLGFLPLQRMRRNTDSKLAAACGQIIAVRADAYEAVGGHAGIARSLHDGLTLARKFRSHGYQTDLFDATNTFACRMYHGPGEVWAGFAKNAREGLGSRKLITPSTLLLLGGQVLPFCLLFMVNSRLQITLAALACLAACLPRLISIIRFRQSILGALLHPFGVFLLVAIQWYAFARDLTRRGSIWKGRSYFPVQAV
jgi:Glycosyl transferase family 21